MSAPFFQFTDRVRPFCEIGFGDARIAVPGGTWDSAEWDDPTSTWGATEPVEWVDVSCYVFEITCEYGRRATTDRFVPGVASLLALNETGWADPVSDGSPGLRPGRSIRFGIDHASLGRRILYRGFIDAVVPTYEPNSDLVELQCIDALGEANRTHLIPFDPATGDGQTADVRLASILDRAHWPASKRDLWPTSWTLISDGQGGQVADLMSRIADSVGGSVWGDHEARIVFRPRDWQMYSPATPVDGTIGNGDETTDENPVMYGELNYLWEGDQVVFFPAVVNTDVCPVAWERPFDRASISTRVLMGRTLETAVQVDDNAGQILYGIETFERTDLLTREDHRIEDLAERTLQTRSYLTAPRVRSVTLDARNGDAQVDLLSTVDVFKPSHYRCRLIDDDGRLVFDDRYMATAVAHHLTASEWSLQLNLDLAAPYEAGGGGWDFALWDAATWSGLSLDARHVEELLADVRTTLREVQHV